MTAILLCSLLITSYSSYEDNSVDPVESIQSSGDIDEFVKVPSNAGDPAVWLPRSR